ncbi:MAG TPA: hypothetical protein VGE93_05825 [Bryobacteraceae bacterium]|nr:hypothetical protein [Acidobacteriaceae bacterium]
MRTKTLPGYEHWVAAARLTNQETELGIFLYMNDVHRQIKSLMKRVEPTIEVIEVLPPQMLASEGTPAAIDPATDSAATNNQEELRSN